MNLRITLFTFLASTLMSAVTRAEIKTEPLAYTDGDVQLEGFIAYDDAAKDKRPGVLVIHEWWGMNEYARERATQLAEMGYVGFAVDMYGKGIVTTDKEKAAELAGKLYGDTRLWRGRAGAALAAFKQHPRVDPARIAAIGFCFGGSTALQMAYGGLDIRGAVSFHGGLAPPEATDGEIAARILILHGADDPMVPDEKVQPVLNALREKKADYQLVYYGRAVHSFSNPKADAAGIPGVAYHAPTADRSWRLMKAFFDELFSAAPPLPGAKGW